jgi:hypothetical protein
MVRVKQNVLLIKKISVLRDKLIEKKIEPRENQHKNRQSIKYRSNEGCARIIPPEQQRADRAAKKCCCNRH